MEAEDALMPDALMPDALMPDALHQDEVSSGLLLSAGERQVLALYDRLKQLQLDIALMRAQQSHMPGKNHRPAPVASGLLPDTAPNRLSGAPGTREAGAADITEAQDQMLDAHASYLLRNEVVEAVLAVNPTLKAVHLATHASPVER